jgi:hypothetical protein
MSATEQLGGLTKVGEWWVLESGERAVVWARPRLFAFWEVSCEIV